MPNGIINQTSWTDINLLNKTTQALYINELKNAIDNLSNYSPNVTNCGFTNFCQTCQTTTCQSSTMSCQSCQTTTCQTNTYSCQACQSVGGNMLQCTTFYGKANGKYVVWQCHDNLWPTLGQQCTNFNMAYASPNIGGSANWGHGYYFQCAGTASAGYIVYYYDCYDFNCVCDCNCVADCSGGQ